MAKAKKTTMKKKAAPKKAKASAAKSAKKAAPKAAPKAVSKLVVKDKPMTKSEILASLAEMAGQAKKDAACMLDALEHVIAAHTKKGAIGSFTLPGLLKINVVKKPATKARKGINPFTGEEVLFKAKPARQVVKVKALKKLKEIVQ